MQWDLTVLIVKNCHFTAVSAFRPFKGDLLLFEYSMNPDTSNINVHTVSPPQLSGYG
jgi:hypothetical protein